MPSTRIKKDIKVKKVTRSATKPTSKAVKTDTAGIKRKRIETKVEVELEVEEDDEDDEDFDQEDDNEESSEFEDELAEDDVQHSDSDTAPALFDKEMDEVEDVANAGDALEDDAATNALVANLEGEEESDDVDSDEDDLAIAEAATRDDFKTMKESISLDPRSDKKLKQRLEKADKVDKQSPGVVYLGRIPHGFYEEEMKDYFKQFGTVSRLRLSRNKRTGRSKHYAFVEFKSSEVARIVAETMNNYLLFGHILKCSVVPEEKIHPDLFQGANRKFKAVPWSKLARARHNAKKTPEERKVINEKLIAKDEQRRQKLQALGIDYDYPGYAAKKSADSPLTKTAVAPEQEQEVNKKAAKARKESTGVQSKQARDDAAPSKSKKTKSVKA